MVMFSHSVAARVKMRSDSYQNVGSTRSTRVPPYVAGDHQHSKGRCKGRVLCCPAIPVPCDRLTVSSFDHAILGNAPFCRHLEAARPRFDTSLIWPILYFPHMIQGRSQPSPRKAICLRRRADHHELRDIAALSEGLLGSRKRRLWTRIANYTNT